MTTEIAGKTKAAWIKDYPLISQIMATDEVFWINPRLESCQGRMDNLPLGLADIDDAEQRLLRFAPYLAETFPETSLQKGIIESALLPVPQMQQQLSTLYSQEIPGVLYLKCDNHLPISGSVKARGGIYEVLKVAEDIAINHRLLSITDDYSVLTAEKFRQLFAKYTILVGSTGNLGLSIGIMSAALGFKVVVHMSADAKQWKKDLLRTKGATVVEHNTDYSLAVAAGRQQAQADLSSHFVDDESSRCLFLGYAVAAKRLQRQLAQMMIPVDPDHPLFVYLPCGVGGAPGGITFGLRLVFGDNVHCFFAEPTHSPAMLLGLLTGRHDELSVQDFGIDNITEADGLAVGRPSGFVGKLLEKDISGVFTVQDTELFRLLKTLADCQEIYLEPSALAGFAGPVNLLATPAGKSFLSDRQLLASMPKASHIVWSTGGGMVPRQIMEDFYRKGQALS